MGDSRRYDPWGFFPKDRGRSQQCFECGFVTTGRHHVVPVTLGGTKVIPLCTNCHNKIHNTMLMPDVIKHGQARARARGVKFGAPVKATKEKIESIKELRSQGFSYKNIALRMNLSVGTIHRIIAKQDSN